jgi:hypothetical protein
MRFYIFVLYIFFALNLAAQNAVNQIPNLHITKTDAKITLDGNLDEPIWQTAALANNFIEKFPRNETFSTTKTEIRVTYDDNFMYFGATCFANKPYIISTLKREVSLQDNDGIAIVLDPIHTKNSGFLFVVSAYGVQGDGLIVGGERDPNRDWDGKWYAEVKQSADRYTVEVAIPFKTLRFEKDKTEWGLNFVRSNLKIGEFSSWSKIPLQFNGTDLGYLGNLKWDAAPKAKKGNIALVPYLNTTYSSIESADKPSVYEVVKKPNAGFDAKIALNSSLNLDVTTNPDFSQVDVDKQVTNLTRFSIFFPEKRTFFLENSDIFSKFGVPPIRPFFSRTIGLDKDGLPLPILYGLRLTGNVGSTTRIGVMNIHTLGQNNSAAQNVSMATVQQNIRGRSYIKGMFLNRQGFKNIENIEGDFARNAGVEGAYISNDGKWTAVGAYQTSIKPNISKNNNFLLASINYSGRNFAFFTDIAPVQTNFFAERGFVARIKNYDAERDTFIRQGFTQSYTTSTYTIYPKQKDAWYQKQEYNLSNFQVFNQNGAFNERNTMLLITLFRKNLSNIAFGATNNDIVLNYPDRFTGTQYSPLPSGRYNFSTLNTSFASDRRKAFFYKIEGKIGGFYVGKIKSLLLTANYRVRPWGNFELNYEYNALSFPSPYGDKSLQLFGSKIEFNFNRNLAWTTFVQINTQNERFNFNSRLQWRFKPLSDVFLVYTDNYAVTDFTPKYRALVLKINYWLNI